MSDPNVRHAAFLVACALAVCSPSLGQDRARHAIADEDLQGVSEQNRTIVDLERPLSARIWAELLLNDFDLVAVGQFSNLPDSDSDSANPLVARDVSVTFEILSLFKGAPQGGSAIKVELISDMLRFPGEDVSRYAKRSQVRHGLTARRTALTEQLATLDRTYLTGDITLEEYEREKERLAAVDAERISVSVALPTRTVGLTHGKTFYDFGGVIRSSETYVVGLKWTAHDIRAYTLEEVPRSGRNIFWGEMADDVIEALKELAR
jgi:hypothetical protein